MRARHQPGGSLEAARLWLDAKLDPVTAKGTHAFTVTIKVLMMNGSLFRKLVADLADRGSADNLCRKLKIDGCCDLVRARHQPGGSLEAARQWLDDRAAAAASREPLSPAKRARGR